MNLSPTCISTNTAGSAIIAADRGLTRSSSGIAMTRDTGITGTTSMKPTKNGGTGPKATDIGVMTIRMAIIKAVTIRVGTGIDYNQILFIQAVSVITETAFFFIILH